MRVAVGMQKGGVGKTTTSINVAGALADKGHDVLCVDADPQGGLTLKLGFYDEYREREYALYDVLADMGELTRDDLEELLIHYEEFDVIPGHLRNFLLEKHLYSQPRGVESLNLALNKMDREYDYIIIDSPPNLGPLSDGALLAAENVLFPSHPNVISQFSLEILFDEIETLEDTFEVDITTIGAVLNEVKSGRSLGDELHEWFHETFGESYVFTIPEWEVIEHAIEYQTSIFGYDADDAGYPWDKEKAEELRERYSEIANHVEETAW